MDKGKLFELAVMVSKQELYETRNHDVRERHNVRAQIVGHNYDMLKRAYTICTGEPAP